MCGKNKRPLALGIGGFGRNGRDVYFVCLKGVIGSSHSVFLLLGWAGTFTVLFLLFEVLRDVD